MMTPGQKWVEFKNRKDNLVFQKELIDHFNSSKVYTRQNSLFLIIMVLHRIKIVLSVILSMENLL